jgi:hypothetical protein
MAKGPEKGPFLLWLGERDGRFAPGHAAAPLRPSNSDSRLQLPEPEKEKRARKGPFLFFWLGERDSNPRWRSQSPQSYH